MPETYNMMSFIHSKYVFLFYLSRFMSYSDLGTLFLFIVDLRITFCYEITTYNGRNFFRVLLEMSLGKYNRRVCFEAHDKYLSRFHNYFVFNFRLKSKNRNILRYQLSVKCYRGFYFSLCAFIIEHSVLLKMLHSPVIYKKEYEL